MGLERALEAHGGRVVRTAVGDRYVVEEMRRPGLSFGGEQSGHLTLLDHATTGDGIVAALQVMAIMAREQRPLSELAHVMERVPQVLVNVQLPGRRPLEDMPLTRRAMSAAEAHLGHEGRVLVRWSGTEAKLRVMLEGPDQAQIEQLAAQIADEATRELS